jgi:hypothetical protein
MKRIFVFLLCVVLIFTMLGCNKQSKNTQTGNAFYYPLASIPFGKGSSAIAAEYRSTEGPNVWMHILNDYFAGPHSEKYKNPFPAGLQAQMTAMEKNTLYVTVSKELAQLSGLELTIACSCLSMTCMELTGAENIVISAENSLLDGQKSITMNKDTLLLIDKAEGE